MFYSNVKKNALEEHKSAVKEYNETYNSLEKLCGLLYENRRKSVYIIGEVEELINSIANTPKSFEEGLVAIATHKDNFRQTEEYAKEATKTIKKSSASAAAGVAGGAAVAALAPTAALWVATTFGTASTGVAISTLSGAAATNAALAWLGGGAIAAGGAGMAAGHTLLALAGPIGWGIAGVSAATSVFFIGRKNKKIAEESLAAAKKIRKARGVISEKVAKVRVLNKETEILYHDIVVNFDILKQLKDKDYLTMSEVEQLQLGVIANNTTALATLLNKTVE